MLGNEHPYNGMLKSLIRGDEDKDYVCAFFAFLFFFFSLKKLHVFASIDAALSLVVVGWLM